MYRLIASVLLSCAQASPSGDDVRQGMDRLEHHLLKKLPKNQQIMPQYRQDVHKIFAEQMNTVKKNQDQQEQDTK